MVTSFISTRRLIFKIKILILPTTTTTPSQRDEDDDDDEHYGMFLTSFYGFVIRIQWNGSTHKLMADKNKKGKLLLFFSFNAEIIVFQ